MARFFLCLLASACCCLALLVPLVQGRIGIGPADNGFISGARDGDPLLGESSAADRRTAATKKAKPVWSSSWTAATKKAKPAWSSSWTAAARPELRSVPGGPDPLHHHGSPWRPEPEERDAP